MEARAVELLGSLGLPGLVIGGLWLYARQLHLRNEQIMDLRLREAQDYASVLRAIDETRVREERERGDRILAVQREVHATIKQLTMLVEREERRDDRLDRRGSWRQDDE